MDYTPEFLAAFQHAMLYEVGPWYNPQDPGTISGDISTPIARRMCGYGNIPGDSGGVTKYGVAQHDNPNVDVANLTLDGAMQIYWSQYWLTCCGDKIPTPMSIIHFDAAVNNGVGRACKFLQGAVGATQDGHVGPITLAAVNAADQSTVINNLCTARTAYYQRIVANDPTQAQFLSGWLRRVTEVAQYSLSQLQ